MAINNGLVQSVELYSSASKLWGYQKKERRNSRDSNLRGGRQVHLRSNVEEGTSLLINYE
jgi:hypothetical protein